MTVLALPVVDLRLAQVDARLLPTSTQTRKLYDALATQYPALARPQPIVVVAMVPTDSAELAQFRDRLAAVPGIDAVEVGPPGAVTVLRAVPDHAAGDDAAGRAVAVIRSAGPVRGRRHR